MFGRAYGIARSMALYHGVPGRHRKMVRFYGAFLGLFAYATYDLTNQATLKNWPLAVTVADLCWGTFLTAVAATVGFLITRAFTSAN